jgi:4-methyl-5(b-hydroxyethyl)-thiazole monophosphate biosynthesis
MIKVLMFLGEGFEALEAASFSDVIGWASIHGDTPIRLDTFGFSRDVKSKWNFLVQPEMIYGEFKAADYDALAIPGGFGDAGFYDDAYDERLQELIKDFHYQNKPIASICVGALPIAKSGILRDIPATTYDMGSPDRITELKSYGAIPGDGNIIVACNIITSIGPSTALDVAFILLRKLTSQDNTDKVRYFMRYSD